jgi:hypothetical protein
MAMKFELSFNLKKSDQSPEKDLFPETPDKIGDEATVRIPYFSLMCWPILVSLRSAKQNTCLGDMNMYY